MAKLAKSLRIATILLMSPLLPKLYVKTNCPWCEEAIDCLDKHSISFEKIIVSNDAQAMKEMEAISGQSKAPTLDWDGEILADFGETELITFLKKLGVY
ncbi:MAG: glutaredoxin family protein [Blastochloris sp.]|nr:glutaredoxin family protein [Blastochloris sp.]